MTVREGDHLQAVVRDGAIVLTRLTFLNRARIRWI